ncbi:MAG: hypothetical protein R3Y57_00225 [Erysipelotrichaceae bacterium]
MKIKSLVVLGTIVSAGAFVVSRWKRLDELDKQETEKKLISLNSHDENPTEEAGSKETRMPNKYPNLAVDFLDAISSQREVFNLEFQPETLVRLFHQISFPNMNNVDYFLKEISDSDYEFDVQVETSVVKLAKNLVIEEDMIINDIFYVANVAAGFEGDYQGYSMEVL